MKQAENPRKKNVESHPKQAALKTTNRPTARDHHGQRRNWPPPGLLRISNQLTHTPIHTPPATFPPLLLAFCVLFLFASPQGRQREREREKKIPTLTDKGTGRKERTRDRERERKAARFRSALVLWHARILVVVVAVAVQVLILGHLPGTSDDLPSEITTTFVQPEQTVTHHHH